MHFSELEARVVQKTTVAWLLFELAPLSHQRKKLIMTDSFPSPLFFLLCVCVTTIVLVVIIIEFCVKKIHESLEESIIEPGSFE
jgi:hypothetical protein